MGGLTDIASLLKTCYLELLKWKRIFDEIEKFGLKLVWGCNIFEITVRSRVLKYLVTPMAEVH